MKKNIYLVLAFTVLIITSCATRIPETDVTPPTFSLEIRGDDFRRTFTQNDPRLQLMLKSNTVYSFIYKGADSGGVELIQWQLGNDEQISFLEPEFPVDGWRIQQFNFLTRTIIWTGERSDPRTGGIIIGRFRTVDSRNSAGTFRFLIRDFGGSSGTPNSASGEFNYVIGDFDTEVINL